MTVSREQVWLQCGIGRAIVHPVFTTIGVRIDNRTIEAVSQLRGEGPFGRTIVAGILHPMKRLERQHANRDWVALAAGATPENAMARDWLVQERAEDIV